ncbi:hypothetical protein MPER_03565, partial [Moniliophthora perniciosa FA553]
MRIAFCASGLTRRDSCPAQKTALGIASIDFRPPFVLSGSSDKHLRLFDITTLQGWSTSPDAHQHSHPPAAGASSSQNANANTLPLPLSAL